MVSAVLVNFCTKHIYRSAQPEAVFNILINDNCVFYKHLQMFFLTSRTPHVFFCFLKLKTASFYYISYVLGQCNTQLGVSQMFSNGWNPKIANQKRLCNSHVRTAIVYYFLMSD